MWTDVYLLSGGTRAIVTPEKSIPRKINVKSPAMSPPRKDPISIQNINILITEQDPSLPPIIEKYTHGYKPLFKWCT